MSASVQAIPDAFRGGAVYLAVKDAAAAIDFYQRAFGARELVRLVVPEGQVMHAEIAIGAAIIMLADENPQASTRSPEALGGSTAMLHYYVEDVDALAERALAEGATTVWPVNDMFWGDRVVQLKDPFGHFWIFATHKEDVSQEEMKARFEAMMSTPCPGDVSA